MLVMMQPGDWHGLGSLDASALTDRLLRNLDQVFEGRLDSAASMRSSTLAGSSRAQRSLAS